MPDTLRKNNRVRPLPAGGRSEKHEGSLGGNRCPLLLAGLLCLAGILMAANLWQLHLPGARILAAWRRPDSASMPELLLRYAFLPRLAVSLLAGASLSLSGLLFQQVLRNPLAEPTTIGVSAGSHLALVLASLWAPSLLAFSQEAVALAGALAATGLVFFLGWSRALSPARVIMAGLVIALYVGSLGSVLSLFFGEDLQEIFIWGTGSLHQNDWHEVTYLLPRFAGCLFCAVATCRLTQLLSLDETSAQSLGVSLRIARLLPLLTAIMLGAFVVSAVGIIGFIGLAAPALSRLAGARRFRDRLWWSPLTGAALLLVTDQLAQWLSYYTVDLPTGTLTALLGSPLLLWLIHRLRKHPAPSWSMTMPTADVVVRLRHPWRWIILGALLLSGLWLTALVINKTLTGWQTGDASLTALFFPLRAPRVFAAAAAGAMLASAGILLQRLTANTMASPEILGIASGSALGVIMVTAMTAAPSPLLLLLATACGSLLTLLALVLLGYRSAFSPEKMLLTGIALGTVVSSLTSLMLTGLTPGVAVLQDWLAGSTYRVFPSDALAAMVIAGVMIALAPLTGRWLDILPLGEDIARATGVNTRAGRLILLVLIALLTAAATLIIGPLSFVGLMAPHMARRCGFHRPVHQLLAAALIGSAIMVLADWCGRNLLFPMQMPAGLLATFIGGPYYLYLMRRSPA